MIDIMFAIGGGVFIGLLLMRFTDYLLSIPSRTARKRMLRDLTETTTELTQLFEKESNERKGQTDKKQNSKVRPKAQRKSTKTSNKS